MALVRGVSGMIRMNNVTFVPRIMPFLPHYFHFMLIINIDTNYLKFARIRSASRCASSNACLTDFVPNSAA